MRGIWFKVDFVKMGVDNMLLAYSHGGNGSGAGWRGV
jgi:hypothetical protein